MTSAAGEIGVSGVAGRVAEPLWLWRGTKEASMQDPTPSLCKQGIQV
jgi:hypothetical protein